MSFDTSMCLKQTCPDGSVLVPGGAYTSTNGKFVIADLCIDLTETSIGTYRSCVDSGLCALPIPSSNYHFEGDDVAVNYVHRYEATMFCDAHGGNLPTSEEMEWVMRRGAQGSPYPWGGATPTCALTSYAGCGVTVPESVYSHPSGATPEMILNLAGNVAEWTSTWVDTECITMGGHFSGPADELVATSQLLAPPDGRYKFRGFRCVYTPT